MGSIYGIENLVNNKVYVGKAVDPKDRFRRHRYLLNANKHWNQYLQNSWNKHGKACFKFAVLEECSVDAMPVKEQEWIDKLGSRVYNLDKNVADKRQDKNPFFGKKHSEETRKKMSAAKAGMYIGSENPNYGKVVSPETKHKMGVNRATKLTVESVLEIKRLLAFGRKHQEIADQFKVARTVVTRINTGERWGHIQQ